MNYKGFEITKKPYILKPHSKKWSFVYGRGNSKTTAFHDTKEQCKAFIDFILESDYATIWNDRVFDLKHKYNDLVK